MPLMKGKSPPMATEHIQPLEFRKIDSRSRCPILPGHGMSGLMDPVSQCHESLPHSGYQRPHSSSPI